MPDTSAAVANPSRLVILLNGVSADTPELAAIPFRYAATAAAMDVAVEVHARLELAPGETKQVKLGSPKVVGKK